MAPKRKPLSNAQAAGYLRQAGFSEDLIPRMVAIANAESSLIPDNRNFKGPDLSYGVWQINMKGDMGPERRAQFGIESNEQLYDPLTNAKAAKAIYDQQGLDAWSVHRSGAADQFMPTAAELGDPTMDSTPTADPTTVTLPTVRKSVNDVLSNLGYDLTGYKETDEKAKSLKDILKDHLLKQILSQNMMGLGGMF